jgi:hypothetical protein
MIVVLFFVVMIDQQSFIADLQIIKSSSCLCSAKYAAACIVTVVLGIAAEAIALARRQQKDACSGRFGKALDVSLFAAQSALGYLLMLVAMTYDSGIFMCVLLGLVAGANTHTRTHMHTRTRTHIHTHTPTHIQDVRCSIKAQRSRRLSPRVATMPDRF